MNVRIFLSLAVLSLSTLTCKRENTTEPTNENTNLILSGRIINWALGDTMQVSAVLQGPHPDSIVVLASAPIQREGDFVLSVPSPPSPYVYRHFGDTNSKFCFLQVLTIRNSRLWDMNFAHYRSKPYSDSSSIGDFSTWFAYANSALSWSDTGLTQHGSVPPFDTTITISNVHLSKGWNRLTFKIASKVGRVMVMEITAADRTQGNWYLQR